MPAGTEIGALRWIGSATRAFSITPDDSEDLPRPTRGLLVGVSGDVKVDMFGGDEEVVLPALAAGVIHAVRISKVYNTDTTATSIVGLY